MLRNSEQSLAHVLIRKAAQLTLVGALAATPLALTAGTASADTDWDALAKCESSGNWSTNTGNGFSGGLQFTPSTWKAFGGSGSAHNASREEQIQVAERVKASQGMNAWPTCSKKTGNTSNSANSGSSSKSASSGSSGSSGSSKKKSTETEAIKAPAPSAVAPAGGYTVVSGDTLSSIAGAHGVSWQQVAQRNGITNPDAISVGQQLALS
jgi:resuscitation-promoting factor RpfA